MNYKAVIFDLDGTLLNTVEDIAFAMNTVLSNHNFPTYNIEAYNYLIGGGLTNLVYQTVPDFIKPQKDLIYKYLEELMTEYTKCIDQHTKPYAGISELLDELSNKKIHLAILSNKDHTFMDKIAMQHFNRWSFQAIYGARQGVPHKPNPQSALEISNIIGLPPKQIIYVGDTDVDMQTATRAGMYAVGVTWGFRTEKELLENGAKTIIHHPQELLQIF